MSEPNNLEWHLEELEYFYQNYDLDFYKIHERYLKGEITIEQQVKLSDKSWNKHYKVFKQAITAKINEIELEARLDELHRADGFTDADYTIKRLAELRKRKDESLGLASKETEE